MKPIMALMVFTLLLSTGYSADAMSDGFESGLGADISIDGILLGKTIGVYNFLWITAILVGAGIYFRKRNANSAAVIISVGLLLFVLYGGPDYVVNVLSRIYW